MEKNLTTGSVFKTILYFALPYLFSYFLQTLYGMADLFIIGQFNGTESTTAVANGSQVMHMLTVMIVGLAMGSTVIIGRAVGARHKDEIAKTVGNSVTLFMGLSIVLTIVLLLLVRPIVLLIQTPVEAIECSIRYLTICFIGIPLISSLPSAVVWVTRKVRCILSRLPAQQISRSTMYLWEFSIWVPPEPHLARHSPRR